MEPLLPRKLRPQHRALGREGGGGRRLLEERGDLERPRGERERERPLGFLIPVNSGHSRAKWPTLRYNGSLLPMIMEGDAGIQVHLLHL